MSKERKDQLAPWAARATLESARLYPEDESALRTPFQRDRDRIVHATAFRRLEYKTQVFVNFEGDHFRTRLTHSLEVAQIARTIARALALDEDLAEAAALAHDLGHSPFGHAGESALDRCLVEFGGFDHNLQTFRILTRLERRYARFDGLNLTMTALESCVKHNGPCAASGPIADFPGLERLRLDRQAPLEAQAAAIADDIAYCSHDLDDGLRAGFFEIDDLSNLPLVGAVFAEVDARHPGIEPSRRAHEGVRRIIGALVEDVVAEAERAIEALGVARLEDVRAAAAPIVRLSPAKSEAVAALRKFLMARMYQHHTILAVSRKARRVVEDLYDALMEDPRCLPDDWRRQAGGPHELRTAQVVRDYIAGMTDRFALDEHDRLFKLSRKSA